jgi:hypothetical protein
MYIHPLLYLCNSMCAKLTIGDLKGSLPVETKLTVQTMVTLITDVGSKSKSQREVGAFYTKLPPSPPLVYAHVQKHPHPLIPALDPLARRHHSAKRRIGKSASGS